MPKNIVFCADGTWNGPGEPDIDPKDVEWSNVFKLFLNLDGVDTPETTRYANEQERTGPGQVAKYIHGIGDSNNKLVHWLSGGTGAGLIARLVRGYTFISRNYEPGDDIFLIGFSRGAYTARALAGMIGQMGLLDASEMDLTDKDAAYRAGSKVWYDYRKQALSGARLAHLEEIALDLPHFVSFQPAPIPLIENVPIHTVAVWDTVGALGIPQVVGPAVDVFAFADRTLGASVAHGRHAVSIDEQRRDFAPTLWEPDARIVQVLFPGAHSDVGGGYVTAECGLSDGSLRWMIGELAALGVKFAAKPAVTSAYDPYGVSHQPWLGGIWQHIPPGPRAFPDPPALCLAQTVLDRVKYGPLKLELATVLTPYAPQNIGLYLNSPAVTIIPI